MRTHWRQPGNGRPVCGPTTYVCSAKAGAIGCRLWDSAGALFGELALGASQPPSVTLRAGMASVTTDEATLCLPSQHADPLPSSEEPGYITGSQSSWARATPPPGRDRQLLSSGLLSYPSEGGQ